MKKLRYIQNALLLALLFSAPLAAADSTLTNLTAATTCGASDLMYVVQSSVSKKITCDALETAIADLGIETSAGTNLVLAATAPVAAIGASQAGKTVGITASAAVASTDTAGAAAGGSVTITGGAAARNASGNASGGDVILTGGAAIGSGAAGTVQATGESVRLGTSGAPSVTRSGNAVAIGGNSAPIFGGTDSGATGAFLKSDGGVYWGTGNPATSGNVSGIEQAASGVLEFVAGVAGSRIYYQWAGQAFLAADGTNDTITPATTGLSTTVTTGRKYNVLCEWTVTNSTAADGIRIDFDGGTATATNFRIHIVGHDSAPALVLSAGATALATDITATTATGQTLLHIAGSFEPSGTGTFIPRFAMEADSGGTLTLHRGSWCELKDMP